MREQKSRLYGIAILLIIVIIIQGLSFYLIFRISEENINQLNQTNEKLDSVNKDLQSKINTLTESISSLTTSQSSLQQQLGQIKASTSSDFSGIIENEIKGVVTIKTDVAQGTGFLIADDGYVVTNAHVLSGGHFANIYTYDNNKYSGTLIGYDTNIDVAILKIPGSFSRLTLGDSSNIKIGEKVIAIGNPLGLSFTATEGIISSKDRTGTNNLPYYFQTDVSLNPGNSGGPLIDTSGDVIGINNFKISGAENIGFALESNYLKQAINDISEKALNQTLV